MRLMVGLYARHLFFVFIYKKIKGWPGAEKGWQTCAFIFFILLVAQLILRTDAIPSSRDFRRTVLDDHRDILYFTNTKAKLSNAF